MFLKFFNAKSAGKDKQTSATDSPANGHGIDTDMKYCASCGDEYRSDIRICAGCDEVLISGEEMLAKVLAEEQALSRRSMEISGEDELITIRKGPVKDMKVLQKLLAAERIPAILAADEGGCRKGCCGPELYLQIRKNDLEEATEVLTREFIRSTALEAHDLSNARAVFNPLDVETVCPACGCRFSPTVGACPECGLCFE